MQQPVRRFTLAVLAAVSFGLAAPLMAAEASGRTAAAEAFEHRVLADAASVTLRAFLRDPQMARLRDDIARARAVLVVPTGVRFGTVNAVVLAKPARWWDGASFRPTAVEGLGAGHGLNAQDVVVLAMTERGARALTDESCAGNDAGLALRVAGDGAHETPDLVAFARGDGEGLGLRLDGARIEASTSSKHDPNAASARPGAVEARSVAQRSNARAWLAGIVRTAVRP